MLAHVAAHFEDIREVGLEPIRDDDLDVESVVVRNREIFAQVV